MATPAVPSRNGRGRPGTFQPWPWAIAGLFVVFFAVQFFLIWKVSKGFEGPDDMQYYRHGLEYGQVVRQQARQRELGWKLTTNLPPRGGLRSGAPFPLQLSLRNAAGMPLPGARVDLKVGRPATRREDRRMGLAEASAGVYGTSVEVGPGTWDFQFTVRHGGETVLEKVRVVADPTP